MVSNPLDLVPEKYQNSSNTRVGAISETGRDHLNLPAAFLLVCNSPHISVHPTWQAVPATSCMESSSWDGGVAQDSVQGLIQRNHTQYAAFLLQAKINKQICETKPDSGDWKDGLSLDFIAKEGRQKWCLQNSVGDHLFRNTEQSATHFLALLFSRKLSGFSQEASKQHNLRLVTETLYPSLPPAIHWGLKYFTFFFPSRNGSCRLNVLMPMTPF